MSKPFYIPKEVLKHLYASMSVQAIGKLFAVDSTTIKNHIDKYGIPLNDKYKKMRQPMGLMDKDLLHELYIVKVMSIREISAFTHHSAVLISREIHRHKIPLRTAGYPNGFIAGKDHGHKKLYELHVKKLKKIRRFCKSPKNEEGFYSVTLANLLKIIDEEI